MSDRRRIFNVRVFWLLAGFAAVAVTLYVLQNVGMRPARLIETGLLVMTPLALAAVGECINEKSGQINIGIEGIFLISAVAGVYWAEVFNSGVLGILAGGIFGALVGGSLGLLYNYGRAEQIIAGMALNIMGSGLFQYLLMAIWAFPGIHVFSRQLVVPRISIPFPGGELAVSPITLIAIAAAFLAALLLYRTLFGLRLRAVGEKPESVDVAGHSVARTRILASILGGFLAGLGGAFMPLGWFGGLVKEITAGRGFIALAAVVFSGLNPVTALAATFIFGFAEGVAFTVVVTPGVKEAVPFHFIQMIPYLLTIAILAAFAASRRFPKALGKPYIRE
ncbi:MAG: ABC transporter permease [Candidatus Caldarchaeum sp.]